MSTLDEVLSGDARFAVVCGDATEVMKTIPDGCGSVCYCDPSYGLSQQSTEDVIACLRAWLDGKPYVHDKAGFMQATWDAWVPGPEAWREVHRCLKPGGYCVAFSSTRTVDLLGIAVRLAGFEMREGWSWAFGGSMPKSHNASKAIDKEAGAVREVTRTATRSGNAERNGDGAQGSTYGDEWGGFTTTSNPVTDAAIQWDGYGTTTKPAFEPLIVARKALDGTVAHNVTTHGCGALNIDAARVTSESRPLLEHTGRDGAIYGGGLEGSRAIGQTTKGRFPAALALVHDEGCVREGTVRVQGNGVNEGGGSRPGGFGNVGADKGSSVPCAPGHSDPDGKETVDAWRCTETCAVAELGRQSGESESTSSVRRNSGRSVSVAKGAEKDHETVGHADAGTAARFFYQAKASASDRLAYITCTAGCAHHESVAFQKDARDSARDASREHPHGFCRVCGGARTHYQHATVKPQSLAAYHARLLSLPPHTRPIALVPFCGTGIEARALLDVGFRVIAIDLDPRHCAMTEFRLTHKEPEHVIEETARVAAENARDWTKPIVAPAPTAAPVTGNQLNLFGASK